MALLTKERGKLARLGGNRHLVVPVVDHDDVSGAELVELPEDLAGRDGLLRREARDERDWDMEGNVAAPLPAFALLDLHLEAAQVLQLPGGPAPQGDPDHHEDDDENP